MPPFVYGDAPAAAYDGDDVDVLPDDEDAELDD